MYRITLVPVLGANTVVSTLFSDTEELACPCSRLSVPNLQFPTEPAILRAISNNSHSQIVVHVSYIWIVLSTRWMWARRQQIYIDNTQQVIQASLMRQEKCILLDEAWVRLKELELLDQAVQGASSNKKASRNASFLCLMTTCTSRDNLYKLSPLPFFRFFHFLFAFWVQFVLEN